MADLLAAALDYAAAGISVFPARVGVVDGRKVVQPVAKWREASTTAPATLAGWFGPGRPWADASLCIDCGKSELVVIDLDVTGGHDGITAWGALMAEHDSIRPTPVRSHTPSGGEHWFYREHERRVVGIDSSGKVAPGVDVRGLGGFVIAWPSEDARGAYGAISPADLATVPVVPDLVIERMTRREAEAAPTGKDLPPATSIWDAMPREFTRAEAVEFCKPAFAALRGAQDGEINHRLNDAAVTIGHFVPEFWTREHAVRILEDALSETAYDGRTWRAEATIASGLGANTWHASEVKTPQRGLGGPDGASETTAVRRGDFTGVRDRKRAEPEFLTREDGKALLYPGKDTYLYAETESGKSWLAAMTVVQCVSTRVPVLVVDFEEGDELEYGQRLLALGLSEAQLCDTSLFRYLMVDGKATAEIMAEADDMGARVVINEGMSVAYDVYGLQVKENDSATHFRRVLVKPHLVAGRAVLTTDHVVKDRDTRGRYAIGGVMKLNAASGGAFLLVNIEGLAPGKRGVSSLYVTKDRPGGVKRHGVRAGDKFDPQVRRIGTLVVDDSREFVSYLDVRITPPAVDDDGHSVERGLGPDIEAAILRIRAMGRVPNSRAVVAEVSAKDAVVRGEIERMLTAGRLIESPGPRGARVYDCVRDLEGDE